MKLVNDDALDALLQAIAAATSMTLCTDSSTDFALVSDTTDTRVLAKVASLTTGDFTIQNGDVSGRKITPDSQDSVDVIRTGVPDNLYLNDTGNSKVLLITTVTSTQQLTTGNKVNIPGFDDEVRDPA
jgi:hypothetical protein